MSDNGTMKVLDKKNIIKCFEALDEILTTELTLIVGGGGALVMAYAFPLATEDVDAFSKERNIPELEDKIHQVSEKLKVPHDWLNPYFSTFTGVLPQNYSQRLREIFRGKNLSAHALGPEDMLIMKCFAGRDKDIPHAKALLRVKGIDLEIVEEHIQHLVDQKYPKALNARDFFDDISDE